MLYQLYKAITKNYQEDISAQSLRSIVPYIYADQAPFGTSYPLITFNDTPSQNNGSMCIDIETIPIQFNCYAKTSEQALQISNLIIYCFANNILSLDDDLKMIGCRYIRQSKQFDFVDEVWVVTTELSYKITEYTKNPILNISEIKIKTDNIGESEDNQIRLLGQTIGNYDCIIDWGDGYESIINSLSDFQTVHNYENVGEYDIVITGNFPGLFFDNGGDRRKILSLNMGYVEYHNRSLYGASNITELSFKLPLTINKETNYTFAWRDCTSLLSFGVLDTSKGEVFLNAWRNCNKLTTFPLIDTSNGNNFGGAWRECSGLITFPLLDMSNAVTMTGTWEDCSSLTSFPAINMPKGTTFVRTWEDCSSLTSFPAIDVSNGVNFTNAWQRCSNLLSFPQLNLSKGENFENTWRGCSNLTSFPSIDTSSAIRFRQTWYDCSSLTSFPVLNTANVGIFQSAWRGCSSLTSFPLLDLSSANTFNFAWRDCSSLVTFPAGFFDNWSAIPSSNCFANAWLGCSSLSSSSVENILNSIDNSGQNAPSGSSSAVEITIDYNTVSGIPNVSTAISNLKSKGWVIRLNGSVQ